MNLATGLKVFLALFIVGPFLLEGFRILYKLWKNSCRTYSIDQKFMFFFMPNIFFAYKKYKEVYIGEVKRKRQ